MLYGGVFSDRNIEIPRIDEEVVKIILSRTSDDFNWKDISPTIFGAVFESKLNPETRHDGGMHYTSIEDIHKVIDPLFLNDLNKELKDIINISTEKTRVFKLKELQDKISRIKILDPSCGSGNFLTETYLSLRKIENKILDLLYSSQVVIESNIDKIIKVSISQFYGIEINDFAVTVAKLYFG
ncbi:MAG: DNA methyltransferase [Peptostreptococcaceae bacterium]